MLTQNQLPDHLISSPGELLEEWLTEHSMTQAALAERMDTSAKFINQLIKGKATLSPSMALRLETVTGVQAETWLRVEAEFQAMRERADSIARMEGVDSVVEKAFVKNLRDAGYVTATRRDKGVLARELLSFFRVATVDALDALCDTRQASYRTAVAFESDRYALEAWMILAEMQAEDIVTQPLDVAALNDLMPRLRAMSLLEPSDYGQQLQDALADVGVALVYVPEVSGARCSGVTLRPINDRAIVALSLRGKSDDKFWFTLFHELGHLVCGHPGRAFLHGEDRPSDEITDLEREANEFAGQSLIPASQEWQLPTLASLDQVMAFAHELGIAPGIVVGRLHHDKLKGHHWGNGLKKRITIHS